MIQISYKFYVHNLKPLPPPDIHQILTMMLRTGQYMLSQEWVSKSVDLKGLNDLWKIACNPTDPVVTNEPRHRRRCHLPPSRSRAQCLQWGPRQLAGWCGSTRIAPSTSAVSSLR